MARRTRTSDAEVIMNVFALLPWWAGLGLAVVFYLVLHHVASQPLVAPTQPRQSGAIVTKTVWRGLATAGQYILPVLCIGGAGLSAYRRRARKKLLETATQGNAADVLDGMSWQQFERLVGAAFQLQGYRVVQTGGGGADGGVDLVLSKDGEKFLVQCKKWRAFKVGVDVVRELYGVMAAKGAAGGFVVTSGRFTDEATRFADGRNLTLIDGPKLDWLMRRARSSSTAGSVSVASEPVRAAAPIAPPSCPMCSKPMVRRTANRGARAGTSFWGCSGYPGCKGTLPLQASHRP